MQRHQKPVKVKVSSELLRRLFDELLIFDKVREGHFRERLRWHSRNSPDHLEPGSSSRTYEYISSRGNRFAIVHQYSDPTDRRIGRPDPKYFLIDDVSFFV